MRSCRVRERHAGTEKLERIHQLRLPVDLLLTSRLRRWTAIEIASQSKNARVRRHPDALRLTLLAAYCGDDDKEIVTLC